MGQRFNVKTEEVMDSLELKSKLQKAFPSYSFDLKTAGAGWRRIFVLHRGISLGRLSVAPDGKVWCKHYKKREYDFSLEDSFFYLFWFWFETGVIPVIDFSALVERAKENRKQKIADIKKWREANPLRKRFVVNQEGECIAENKRRRGIERAWMPEFRRLVGAALEKANV